MFKDKYKKAADAVRMTDADKSAVHASMHKTHRRKAALVPIAVAACIVLVAAFIISSTLKKPAAIAPSQGHIVAQTANAKDYREVYDVVSKLQADMARDGMYYTNGIAKNAGAAPELETVPVDDAPQPTGAPSDDYSKTNVQIEGVDESDIIKTDGRYIYVLSHDVTKGVRIFKADGKDTKLVTKIKYAKGQNTNTNFAPDENSVYYYTNGMYLTDGKLIVIAWRGTYSTRSFCCDWYYPISRDGETHIYTYDVKNPEKPTLISDVEQDGYYIESRVTGGVLYTVTTYGVGIWDEINMDAVEDYIPTYKDSKGEHIIAASDITLLENAESARYCVATAVDLQKSDEIKSSIAILGQVNGLFASNSNILLYNTYYDYEERPAVADGDSIKYVSESDDVETYAWKDICRTDLFLVTMNEGDIRFEKTVKLEGWIDDQFSIDEYKDSFRIVLTISETETLLKNIYDDDGNLDGQVFEAGRPIVENKYNQLIVLNKNLETIGKIDDIAKGEMIKSARFMGDVGYFVTFRQTDPLFSVDLSDAKNPKIIGSLKIPGFSEYLQSYGDGLLFGLGFDADIEEGGITGVKMSMFDVSDPADVKEIAKKVYKNKWSGAVYNHKAILANPEKNLIGFSCEDSYVIFSFEDGKFVEKASVEARGDWSYDLRGLYIGSFFYVADMQNDTITVLDLTTFENVGTVG